MQEFLDSIRKGEFMIPICTSCSSAAWPPSRICSRCYSPTILQKIMTRGKVVEFAFSNLRDKQGQFGLIDIGGVWIVGRLECNEPRVGMVVEMAACGIGEDGSPFYNFVESPTLI